MTRSTESPESHESRSHPMPVLFADSVTVTVVIALTVILSARYSSVCLTALGRCGCMPTRAMCGMSWRVQGYASSGCAPCPGT